MENALQCFLQYTEICETGYGENPESGDWKNLVAISYSKLGDIYQAQGKFEEALGYFEKETVLFEELYATNPRSESLKNGLAIAYYKIAGVYLDWKKVEEVVAPYEKCLPLARAVYANNPLHVTWLYNVAFFCRGLGSLYQVVDRKGEALPLLCEAVGYFEELYTRTGLEAHHKELEDARADVFAGSGGRGVKQVL